MNSFELNLSNLNALPQKSISKEKTKEIDEILSFEFYLATALRKAYKINMTKNHLEGFFYFDEKMRKIFLVDYREINLSRKFESGKKIEVMK
jgi:hypothetical protein